MFILGVGAHKAGTTWLWKQLGNAPGRVSLGRKELHYWDNLIRLESQTLRDEQELQAFMTDDSIEAIASLNHDKYFTPVKRAQRVRWGNRNEQRFTADITPAYAGLPRGVFAYIRRQLQLREVDYRIIYFMRDPVARIVSAFNYLLQTRTLEKFVKSPLRDEGSAEKFIRYATSTHCQLRTRYEITVANLSEVFPSDRLFSDSMRAFLIHPRLRAFLNSLIFPSRCSTLLEQFWSAGTRVRIIYLLPRFEMN